MQMCPSTALSSLPNDVCKPRELKLFLANFDGCWFGVVLNTLTPKQTITTENNKLI